jgi:hypothetical protein
MLYIINMEKIVTYKDRIDELKLGELQVLSNNLYNVIYCLEGGQGLGHNATISLEKIYSNLKIDTPFSPDDVYNTIIEVNSQVSGRIKVLEPKIEVRPLQVCEVVVIPDKKVDPAKIVISEIKKARSELFEKERKQLKMQQSFAIKVDVWIKHYELMEKDLFFEAKRNIKNFDILLKKIMSDRLINNFIYGKPLDYGAVLEPFKYSKPNFVEKAITHSSEYYYVRDCVERILLEFLNETDQSLTLDIFDSTKQELIMHLILESSYNKGRVI